MQTVSFQSLKSELTCNGCPFWFVLFIFSCERLHHGCSVQKRILGYGFNSVTHNFSLPISIMQFGRMVYFTVEFFPQTFVENWLDLSRISEWKNLERIGKNSTMNTFVVARFCSFLLQVFHLGLLFISSNRKRL